MRDWTLLAWPRRSRERARWRLGLRSPSGGGCQLDAANVVGYAYPSLVGTARAYTLWFRGIQALPVTDVPMLGLLSPVVTTALGWLALSQTLTAGQVAGAVIVLAALILAQRRPTPFPPPGRPIACKATEQEAKVST